MNFARMLPILPDTVTGRNKILTISELTRRIRSSLEQDFFNVWIVGEVSNMKKPTSGHVYLTLKDAGAQLQAVMFKFVANTVKFELKDGMEVLAFGSITVYEARGQYQLVIEKIEPKGIGALQLAFLQLKERLEKEGLFDPAHKKPLPMVPQKIAIVTSLTGAAIRDILNVINRRFAKVEILIYPVKVQGEGAALEIARAIKDLNTLPHIDVMIVGRGGGSLEESRVGGVFEQPNMLGAFFVYNMFFFLSFFLYYYRSLKYWLLLIPFLACLRGIMVTFSRGAYLAFGAGGIMTTFFRSKVLFIIAMFLFMASLINPIYLPQGMRERLASTFGGEKVMSTNVEDITDKSAGNRIIIWKGAIEMIKAKPMFGFGYGTFPYIIGYFIPAMKDVDAHNTYLIIAAEMGIPALLIFLLILFMLIKNAVWLLKRTKERYFKAFAVGILGNIFGLLLANMFGSRLNSEEVSSYFWIYAGLIMAAVNMKKKGEIN